jgi:ADP-L-glycero-D-manno-heptose 6-epimerase
VIVVTGAAGFIGNFVLKHLAKIGFAELIAVDDFRSDREYLWDTNNALGAELSQVKRIHRDEFPAFLTLHQARIQVVIHLGARTDTTSHDLELLHRLNTAYTQTLWKLCTEFQIPLVYASSAATYGDGAFGFEDDHNIIPQLKPLNPYGQSKQDFDLWALNEVKENRAPFFWAGLKFFNVYGPFEDHKGRMASVIWHAYNQIKATGSLTLFKSHNPDYSDGGQLRDFIYVEDIAQMIVALIKQRKSSGIYNAGTGKARTFLDLGKAVFSTMNKPEDIFFIPTPEDIRERYQYFTQAEMTKWTSAGYAPPSTSLEEGVERYIRAIEAR